MYRAFCLGLLCALWSACQHTEPAPKTVATFYVRYLKPEGQVLAEATLLRQQGDSLYSIDISEGMRYRGALMRLISAEKRKIYRHESKSTYFAEHPFQWTDTKGQTRRFSLTMSPLFDVSLGASNLPMSKPATLTWHGPPIAEGETWVIMWEHLEQGTIVPMEIVATPGLDRIDFPAAQLAKLNPGRWAYYVVRKKVSRQELPDMSVQGIVEYYSDTDTVTLRR